MADYERVLKCWGAIEADYVGHGGEVLTRSVPDSSMINVNVICSGLPDVFSLQFV